MDDKIDYTEEWLALYAKALTLSPGWFERFMFGVGMFGTDEERYYKGKAIFEMIRPAPKASFSFCCSDGEDEE